MSEVPPRKKRHIEEEKEENNLEDMDSVRLTQEIEEKEEEQLSATTSNGPNDLQQPEHQPDKPDAAELDNATTNSSQSNRSSPDSSQQPPTKKARPSSMTPDRRVSFAPNLNSQEQQQQRQQRQPSQTPMSDSFSPPPTEHKPRLVITKMVLNNFKSYAGRQVIGPFQKSFSAIVGPNGSGKSNVIDALLFVFGYRANKMRQGKLSELIHNSAKHPNCSSCSVEIHFQEIVDGNTPTEYEKVPNSRLMISRHAFRNNSSKYQINERTSSYTEVTTLLRKRGIDLDHKRFLILQGEVESIALMKPKAKDEHDDGLLEYLEDIIGTSIYKDPIESANKRLEELNEDRVEKLNRARYVGKEKDSLEGKKREAEMFLENENELARKKNELYQVYIYEAKDNISVANTAVEELKRKLEEEKTSYDEIEKEQADMSKQYQGAVKEYDAFAVKISQVKKKQNKFEKDEVQLRERKEHLLTKKEKSKAALEKDQEASVAARDAIKKNGEELIKRRKDLKQLEKQLKEEEAKMEEINKELTGKTDEYKGQIEELQKERAPWTEKINKKKKDIDIRKSEKEILEEKMSSGAKAVQEAEAQVDRIEKTRTSKHAESEALPKQIETLRNEIEGLEQSIKNMDEREGTCRKEVSLARHKADEARSSLQQSQSRGKVLDSLLRMRDSGRIKGIYDRLGNLGVIDDKYDVAVSTACPALDNIVVETVEAGQACIEYLRKNNLGRASFIILDKLGRQDTRSIDTPENVPRLFDLIKPKHDRFNPAFYSVLRDTLVAQNLKQANHIAYGRQRWRVVTLDGKLIEKSGAMTGGGNRQLRGAMGSHFKDDEVSAETVAQLEHERDKLEEELRNIVEQKRAAELGLRSQKESLPRKEMSLEKLQMDMRSLDQQLEDARQRRDTLKTQMEPKPEDVERYGEIGEEIENLEEEMAELEEKPKDIDAQIESLQDDIMDAGGMDLRLQKIVVDDVNKRIENLNTRITKAMVAKAKAEKDIIKLESTIKKYEQEDGKIEEDIKKLEAESAEKAKEATEITKQMDDLTKNMEEKQKEIDGFKNDLDEKTKQINELRKSEIEIKNKLENYQRSLADNQRKVVHWNEQRAKLSLHNYRNQSEEELTLPEFDDEGLKELQNNVQETKTDIAEIEALVENAKPNLSVLEEYRRREEEYNGRVEELNGVTAKRDEVKNEAERLRKQRLDEFMQGFNVISQKLKEMYQMITMGGNAELELVDSLDPFSEGIVFSVMPPKKSWKNISNLSGGEKTLSSLALVFALHHFKPTPLYVMDEIDAALDFRNVSIVANYIAERTKNAQFVIISLRNNMFELADRLVGIYKTNDCTKSIAINPSMIAMLTELHQPETNTSNTGNKNNSNNNNNNSSSSQQQPLVTTSRNPTPS